jgi:CBS domain-containing protein
MRLVRDLLAEKGTEIWSVAPTTSVLEALRVMAQRRVGALLVLDGDKVEGMFSERDYARKVVLMGKSSKDTPVRDIMSPKVVSVAPAQSTDECMALMTEHRIRHLPVMNDGAVVGVISIGDVVKAQIAEREEVIQQLEGYITGTF